jgi:Zn-dependent M28 family amino/carboxypeptidase
MHIRLILSLFITTPLFAASLITPDVKNAAAAITDASFRAHIKYLSSDELEGRGTGARGDDLAVDYIKGELKKMGVKPGAQDGSWTQKVPLVGMTSVAPATTVFEAGSKKLTLKYHDDFIAVSGAQNPTSKIDNAEVVFVGYGIVAPEFKWDDFKDADVKGKVLLVMNYNPTSFAGKRRLWYGRWDYKYEQAAKKGAVGVIIIHTTPSAAYPWQVVQSSWTGERFELAYEGEPRLEVMGWATEDACRKIAALSGHDLDKLRAMAESREFKPVALNTRWSMQLANTIRKTQSDNVIGIIEGSDAKLKQEAVIYTAHHDHLGKKGTAIYHGALDNASGVSAVLNIAKAFKALKTPIKRSVYFVLVAAEEQGLLGSAYFAKHPPIPAARIAANINLDGVGFFGKTRDIAVVGLGKTSLDADIVAIAKEQGRVANGDAFPEHGAFYRSDQFSFAKVGVPAVFFEPGIDAIGKPEGYGRKQNENYTEHDYHQPSDVYKESWDLAGAIEDATLEFALGVTLANAPQMPTWNRGDEFEAVRLKNPPTPFPKGG